MVMRRLGSVVERLPDPGRVKQRQGAAEANLQVITIKLQLKGQMEMKRQGAQPGNKRVGAGVSQPPPKS
jgi:hypothetical protein